MILCANLRSMSFILRAKGTSHSVRERFSAERRWAQICDVKSLLWFRVDWVLGRGELRRLWFKNLHRDSVSREQNASFLWVRN